MKTEEEISKLITDDWRLNGSVYTDEAIFTRELATVFRNSWLYVAHESQLRNPGDYVTTYAGTQPVIVSRGRDDGQVHVMLNRCRHRGATVCQEAKGNANFFRCAYHGWTYTNSGELRGVTYDQGYGELDRENLGLIQLPRVDSYAGFIFASFADEGPSLEEYLGHAGPYLDIVAKQGPQGIRLDGGAHKLEYPANWKLQIENTIDNYHFGFVHRSFIEVLADRIGSVPPIIKNIQTDPTWRTIDLGNGHSVHEFGSLDGGNNQAQIGDLPFNLIIFPNLGFVGAQLRHVQPVSATKTQVNLYPILHDGESDEHNAEILRTHESFYGPAGMGGMDDVEVAFNRVSDGIQATEHDWLIVSRGLHREEPTGDGRIIGRSDDEVPQRAFYRGWLKMMQERA